MNFCSFFRCSQLKCAQIFAEIWNQISKSYDLICTLNSRWLHFGVERERRKCKFVWWTLQSEAERVNLMTVKMCGIQSNQLNQSAVQMVRDSPTHWHTVANESTSKLQQQNFLFFPMTFLHVYFSTSFRYFVSFGVEPSRICNKNKRCYWYIMYRNGVCFDFGFGFSTIEFPCEWTFVVLRLSSRQHDLIRWYHWNGDGIG